MEKNSIISKTGKRKAAIANTNLLLGKGIILINNKEFSKYTQQNLKLMKVIQTPLDLLEISNKYDIIIQTKGGGIKGQADAIKLGISRVIYEVIKNNEQILLKKYSLLTRNSLCKERRKYGLKKARKASQFSKR